MKRRERVSSFLIVEAGLILLNILCYGDIRWLLLEQIFIISVFLMSKKEEKGRKKNIYMRKDFRICCNQ